VDERDLRGEVGQEQRLFHGGIAAADHHDFLPPIEEAVTGGAGRNAEALERLFRGQAKPLCLRAGTDDQRVAGPLRARFAIEREGTVFQIDRCDVIEDHFRAHVLRLGLHLIHQPGTLNGFSEAGIILYIRGDRQLTAGLHALQQHGFQRRACRVNGCGVARRSGTQNDHPAVV